MTGTFSSVGKHWKQYGKQRFFGSLSRRTRNCGWHCLSVYPATQTTTSTTILTFVMTLWCIWKRLNKKLWNDTEISLGMAVHMTRETLLLWQQAQAKKDCSEKEERNNNESIRHDQSSWR